MITDDLSENTGGYAIKIFPFHEKLKSHFRDRKKTWEWFSNQNIEEEAHQKTRTEILKNTLRLEKTDHEELYELTSEICKELQIDAEVTLYQKNNSIHLNTSIFIIKNEAHIVFSGNVLSLLNAEEKKALLGHELGHYLFSSMDDASFKTTSDILSTLAADQRSDDVYIETNRKFDLYLELFCDMCALKVTSDHKAVASTLLKLETGLANVNPESYLKQALQIIEEDNNASEGITHPESYIRCIALDKTGNFNPDDDLITQLVEGKLNMNTLDIFQQNGLNDMTLELILLITKPEWMRTERMLNLAAEYYSDFSAKNNSNSIEELDEFIKNSDENVKEYFSYILLDFSCVDPELHLASAGQVLELSELIGLKSTLEKTMKKELKLTQKAFNMQREKILKAFTEVRESKENSLYKD